MGGVAQADGSPAARSAGVLTKDGAADTLPSSSCPLDGQPDEGGADRAGSFVR
jgi:hypothetical protein